MDESNYLWRPEGRNPNSEKSDQKHFPHAVIPDCFYWESILEFLNVQQLLAGVTCLPRSLTTVPKRFSMLPGFAPAGEQLLFGQKWPKPLTLRLATLDGSDAGLKSGPTRCPQTRPAEYKERPTLGPDSRRRIVRKGC
jgi:hypothetical protein